MPSSAKSYFTINADLLTPQTKAGNTSIDQQINLNIYLSDAGLLTPLLFEKLRQLKNDFIFSIAPGLINVQSILPEILSKLYLLASFNLYTKENEITIPLFFNDRLSSEEVNTNPIISFFREQGFANVQLPFFNYPGTQNNIQHVANCRLVTFPSNLPNHTHPEHIIRELGNDYPGITIIVFDEEPANLILFDKSIRGFADSIGNPFSTFHFDNLPGPCIAESYYEEEKKRWKQRALLYQDFLQLSKTVQEKEYYEVLNWYHNEYEILPLWYKRFGHVIKVLMGKRSFRSLFSDRVKKYKD